MNVDSKLTVSVRARIFKVTIADFESFHKIINSL